MNEGKKDNKQNTKELILKISALLNRHIFFKDKRLPLLIAVWVLGTYLRDDENNLVFTYYGYLWVNSPVKRCGKSLLEDILTKVCSQATSRISNLTESVIFHLADKGKTLIVDELETLRRQDKDKYGAIMSVLNAGFQAGSKVYRMKKAQSGGFEEQEFNAFCPKVLAGINTLADTLEDRAFKITMVRKTENEKVDRFSLRQQETELESLREALRECASDVTEKIINVYSQIKEFEELRAVDDRFKDIAEPLLAIAIHADEEDSRKEKILPHLLLLLKELGGERGEIGQSEAIGAVVEVAETLLKQSGKNELFVATADLRRELGEYEELSWIVSDKSLGNFLRKFGLSPRRDKQGHKRGYLITQAWVKEIRTRYVPLPPNFDVKSVSEPLSERSRTTSGVPSDFDSLTARKRFPRAPWEKATCSNPKTQAEDPKEENDPFGDDDF